MTVRDELAGQSMEIREPFVVGPPLPRRQPVAAQAPPPARN